MPDDPRTRTDQAAADDMYVESRARLARPLGAGERLFSAALGGAFLVAAIALGVATSSGRSPSLALVAVLVLSFAALANVEFEIGAGSAIPTQLILVPMLFLLPLGWVPLAVAAGYWVSLNADVVRGRRHRERVVVLLCSCWYVFGPVLVLLVWGEGPPRWSHWPVYVAALAAQFGADLASTLVRERRALGISLRRLVPMAAIAYGVDLALAPLGLLAAFAAIGMGYAFLLLLPVAVLLAIFARERRQRLEQEEELNVAYRRTMLLLGDIIEADDEYTGSHSRSVVELVVAGRRACCELTPAQRHAGGVRRAPARRRQDPHPEGHHPEAGAARRPEERALIETHTIEGELMLDQVGGSLSDVGHIVRSCHECWDGTRLPRRGWQASRSRSIARIVCCCDAWSAMTTDRPTAPPSQPRPRSRSCGRARARSSTRRWSTRSSWCSAAEGETAAELSQAA